jgi:hypothetical protein
LNFYLPYKQTFLKYGNWPKKWAQTHKRRLHVSENRQASTQLMRLSPGSSSVCTDPLRNASHIWYSMPDLKQTFSSMNGAPLSLVAKHILAICALSVGGCSLGHPSGPSLIRLGNRLPSLYTSLFSGHTSPPKECTSSRQKDLFPKWQHTSFYGG